MVSRLRCYALYALLVLGISGITAPASGQISAEWPTDSVDLSSYATVYECLAASQRSLGSAPERSTLRDTLPQSADDVLAERSSEPRRTARACSARFHADSVPVSEYAEWIMLYLQAGRDADASRVAARRLAATESGELLTRSLVVNEDTFTDSAALRAQDRALVLSTVARLFVNATPSRLRTALPYIHQLQTLPMSAHWMWRASVIADFFTRARVAGDTGLAYASAEWLVTLPDSVTELDRNSFGYRGLTGTIMAARHYLAPNIALDSLRTSTSAYVALQRVRQRQIGRIDDRLGTSAPVVEGAFWFPRSLDPKPPRAGRVTIIVGGEDGANTSREVGAILRRWKSRFPALEIVYVTNTAGYFDQMEPPSRSEEAAYRSRLVRDFNEMPVTMVVENTPFWRLPAPDRRRINESTSGVSFYRKQMWLVDQDGIIIHHNRASKTTEPEFTELIEVLLTR